MRWLAWAACLALAAVIAVAAHAWLATGITTQLQPIDHALVSFDGRQVTVPALGGGCIRRAALTATQTTRTVLLRLTAYSISGPHVACAANVRLLQASTTLDAPLGERPLVDASTHHLTAYIPEGDLAHPGWLPRGATGPTNSPLEGWTRAYTFPKPMHRAPLTIVENPRAFSNQDRVARRWLCRRRRKPAPLCRRATLPPGRDQARRCCPRPPCAAVTSTHGFAAIRAPRAAMDPGEGACRQLV
jgi:hypothetical protein